MLKINLFSNLQVFHVQWFGKGLKFGKIFEDIKNDKMLV